MNLVSGSGIGKEKKDTELTMFAKNAAASVRKKNIKKMATKTLNEYLFEQLERLSNAEGEDIEVEKEKAKAIISISEQVLEVAKFKLAIIQAGGAALDHFNEIDHSGKSLPSSDEGDKKKLQ